MRPGISTSASWISLRPQGASERSATLKSAVLVAAADDDVDMALTLPRGQSLLELDEHRNRPRIQALLGRQVERDHVPEEDQVHELGQVALALGHHLLHRGDDLAQDLVDQLEAAHDLGVLG